MSQGLLEGYYALGEDVNKFKGTEQEDGSVSEQLEELTLDLSDTDLIALKNKWISTWKQDESAKLLDSQQKENEKYWKGQHFDNGAEKRPLSDNIIFQAVETLLPIITRENPEPTVEADNTDLGNQLAKDLQMALTYQADDKKIKMKMQDLARYWSLYFLGVMKVGWDMEENDIAVKNLRPQKLILDPNAVVEDCEYKGEYIGEYRQDTANVLIKRFPKQKEYIIEKVNDKLGTKIQYEEWWTDDYVFWSLEQKILGKIKNPHWDYGETKTSVDEFGQTTSQTVQYNHFVRPRKPYIFLCVYNLGKHPWDETSIVNQNLSLQDMINKRQKQLDKNADNTNNGIVISGDSFTKEQASQAADALTRGGVVWIPTGSANSAISRTTAPPLPQFVYQSLVDYRNELMNIFGVRGTTPQGTMNEETVRGKIIVRGQDAERSGLIVEHLEQFADDLFNWMVQLMAVYYTEEHFGSIVGDEKAKQFFTISRSQLLQKKFTVSVKAGSLIPKDALTKANQAIDLFLSGNLDPVTAFDILDFPNPKETAEKLFLWKTNPGALFGMQPQMATPQASQGQPQAPQPQPTQQPNGQANPDLLSQVPTQ